MAFLKKTYHSGDVFTTEDMNNIMNGIEEAISSDGGHKTYDTIALATTDTNLKVGDIVYVKGYYNANDGGNHYRIVQTTSKVDGKQIANSKYLNVYYTDIIHSKWCGCYGDNATDDTQLLSKFFSENYGKATLVVDPGIYYITDTVKLQGSWQNSSSKGTTNNRAYRECYFVGASLNYQGVEGGCSIQICHHYRSKIEGLATTLNSVKNYVNVVACWMTEINNLHIYDLWLNGEKNKDKDFWSTGETDAYFMFYLSFHGGNIGGSVNIFSVPNANYNPDYPAKCLNSLFFDDVVINPKEQDYCINLYGAGGLENFAIERSDLSYSKKAIFYVDEDFINAVITLKNIYFDESIPLTTDEQRKRIFFNMYDCYDAQNVGDQAYLRSSDMYTTCNRIGCKGVEANNLPSVACNYLYNGDFAYSDGNRVGDITWVFGGAYDSIVDATHGTMHGKAVRAHILDNGICFRHAPLPCKGTYTITFKCRMVSGTPTKVNLTYGDGQNTTYKIIDISMFQPGDEFILSTYGNGFVTSNSGDTHETADAIGIYNGNGSPSDFTFDILEATLCPGTYRQWNCPMHPSAMLSSPYVAKEDFNEITAYEKSVIEFSSSTNYSVITSSYNRYMKQGNMCTLSLSVKVVEATSSSVALATIPTPKDKTNLKFSVPSTAAGNAPLRVIIDSNGSLKLYGGTANATYEHTVSYICL